MENKAQNKKVGLLFGSFNPIHVGHLALGRAAMDAGHVSEVWFVVSPHNPDKPPESLAPFPDRLEMVRRAIGDDVRMQACDIENELPRPSYSYVTLRELRSRYPDHVFALIAGDDIMTTILSWEFGDEIVAHHDLIVRNRSDRPVTVPDGMRIHVVGGVLELSATNVRDIFAQNQKPTEHLPEGVLEYIESNGLYGSKK